MNRRKFFQSAAAMVGVGAVAQYLPKIPTNPHPTALVLTASGDAYVWNQSDFYGEWEFVSDSLSDSNQNKSSQIC